MDTTYQEPYLDQSRLRGETPLFTDFKYKYQREIVKSVRLEKYRDKMKKRDSHLSLMRSEVFFVP